MKGSIYLVRNTVNDKVYVGQTTQPVECRFKQHLKLLKTNECQAISRAIQKYGKDSFCYEVLEEEINLNLLDDREEYYIQKYDSLNKGYNLCPGGQKWRNKPLDLPKSEIVEKYKEGLSSRKIAETYKVSHSTVLKILNEFKITRTRHHNLPDRSSKITQDELHNLLIVQKLTQREISKILGVDETTIYRAIKRHNLKRI